MKVVTTISWFYATGTTNSLGFAYVYLTAPGYLDFMSVTINNPNYDVLSAQGTFGETSFYLYPTFNVGLDIDGNDVIDAWEMPLAQKFCPYLILHSGDNGVRPVPVESMDRNGDGVLGWEDVLVLLYDIAGNPHGEYGMDEIAIGTSNHYFMYLKYPHLAPVHKEPAIPDVNGNGIFGESGEAQDIYLMVPHFEWGDIGNTNPTSWYATWTSFIQLHSSESAFFDGTTYANFFKNGNETVIQYWFFYPFNPAANRHEGDWEHINMVLNSQNPNSASITRVEYYFHEDVAPRYTPGVDYFLISGTHPKVFVGGRTSFLGVSGEGTHGSFPFSGEWPNINLIGTNETVDGLGLHIDFANYQNIVILPAVESVNVGDPLEWMTYAAFWGHVKSSPSAGDNLDLFGLVSPFFCALPVLQPWITIVLGGASGALAVVGANAADDASIAPIGPAIKSTWNKIYNQTGLHHYTER